MSAGPLTAEEVMARAIAERAADDEYASVNNLRAIIRLLDAERAAHRETIREMQGADANWMVAANARDAAEARVQRLEEALRTAMQRCNESGIGEAGLVATIHAVHGILRAALAADQKKGS